MVVRWPFAAWLPAVLVAAMTCGPKDHFMYKDTEGRVCDPLCQGKDGPTCTSDLKCNVPTPTVDCSQRPQDSEGMPLHWYPCWLLGLSEDSTLSKAAMGLCQGCCCTEVTLCRGATEGTCRPLICDEDGPPAPEPLVCRDGHVIHTRLE